MISYELLEYAQDKRQGQERPCRFCQSHSINHYRPTRYWGIQPRPAIIGSFPYHFPS